MEATDGDERQQRNNQRERIYRRSIKETVKKTAKAGLRASAGVTVAGVLEMVDTFDRRFETLTARTYSEAGKFKDGLENKPGKRLPKAGLYAGAGWGLARAQWSIFEAEAKGPNGSVLAEASMASLSLGACAKAEVASVSVAAGPVKATAGLAFDIGASVSPTHIEAKVLGTGFSFGSKMGFSLFGTGFEFKFW